MEIYANIVDSLLNDDNEWVLDPSIELHETYEVPTWELFTRLEPSVLRWLTPQFSFEALLGVNNPVHWVDFLLCSPFIYATFVFEIDGNRDYEDEYRLDDLEAPEFTSFRLEGRRILREERHFCDWVRGCGVREPFKPFDGPSTSLPSQKSSLKLEERYLRKGWDIEYTTIGGKLRKSDPYELLDEASAPATYDLRESNWEDIRVIAKERVNRLTSQVFLATSVGEKTQDPNLLYWVTVCQKILQLT